MYNNQTFLFYDLETSGINNSFDQILQFAAVRTDLNFNEIERFNFFVKLNPDTTPSPMATITHHISIAEANSKGISEYQAVRKIHKIINTPGTISMGYNTLGFDDEFLRFAFFKNMLPPYTHQYKNSCFRADLFPIVACYYLFFNEALKWPEIVDEEGKEKVSLKLENLNSVNNLCSDGRAHDAIIDVLVTVELAKKLQNANPKMWQFLLDKFNKQNDEQVLNQLDIGINLNDTQYKQAIAVSGVFGFNNNFMSAVLDLGQHHHYKNQEIFLRLDSYLFSDFIEEFGSLESEYWRLTVSKKWGDIPVILPAKTRFVGKLSEQKLGMIKANKEFMKSNLDTFANFIDYVLEHKYATIENIDTDAAIYQSDFMTTADEKGCELFHSLAIVQKVQMLSQLPKNYYDRAVRIIGRLDFLKLPEKAQYEFQKYLNKIVSLEEDELLVDHRGCKRVTLEKIYKEIEHLRETQELTQEQHSLLYELEEYLF
ncbi:exodeoxyribonuclease I [Allofrancisella guangzhouensis]|uniref:Exodeoxyribonuclease I n=1 Tax=Allofrancisella guangzhouensis TaxID=594679 RepID=A0A0A8E4F8_9GAMM|nr:exodeoxyribonuclease I [Allofrancisella guangzhouensis]AJC48908.1 exodeoxyribonuclease I [Allofrancisella guangzhouensis]MBK2027131.1 exodeoxyribonuclease I [Allofrancisella guangzhouensis]MBK2043770.1 exodeoxyribonuclease I [Allofrancisella guangzhouensis]MBK2045044.1 exodeoxyribonuclease I [Allofrancisella guangzhouensis]